MSAAYMLHDRNWAVRVPLCSIAVLISKDTTRQRDVLELGKRGDQELRWQISFCRDGSFAEKR